MPSRRSDPKSAKAPRFASVDDYLASFPATTQDALQEVRRNLHDAIPGADEKISYDIPTLTVGGKAVVYFAGWKQHVSLYPLPEGDAEFDDLVAPYRSGASTAKFPLKQPVPWNVVHRAGELLARRVIGDKS